MLNQEMAAQQPHRVSENRIQSEGWGLLSELAVGCIEATQIPMSSPSPPAPNPSQHQGLFQ